MNTNDINKEEERSALDLIELGMKMVRRWPLFLVSISLLVIIAVFFTYYSTSKYETKAVLLIKSNENALSQLSLLSSGVGGNKSNLQNEIEVIRSSSLSRNVIKSLNLYVNYYQINNLKKTEIYKDSPFDVEIDLFEPQVVDLPIKLKLISKTKFNLSYNKTSGLNRYDYSCDNYIKGKFDVASQDKELSFGQWYEADGMRFRVNLREAVEWSNDFISNNYCFVINDLKKLIKKSTSEININTTNREASVVNIVYNDNNQQKAIDYINTLCKTYIDITFEEKNYLHTSTIKFVDSQINSVSDSLNIAERKREEFQIRNKTIDLTTDAKFLFDKANELETRKAEEYTKKQYFDYLSQYLKQADMDAGVVAPAVMGVEDLLINNLVAELATKLTQKKSLSLTATSKNIQVQRINAEINSIKLQIEENIRSLKKISNITTNEINRQLSLFQTELNKLPSTQRNMINIERQFKFNDEIYTFLYQKRAEAEIAQNSALPDHKIIDNCDSADQIYPKITLNVLIAIILGLLIPALYIFLRDILENKLGSKVELEKMSKSPIIGFIPEVTDKDDRLVVFSKPKSQVTEAFRLIRTNLNYLNIDSTAGKIILVTSSMPSDGKTFITMNLASILALSGARTIVVGYDLRKPKLHIAFDVNNRFGVSNYLIGNSYLEDSIQSTEFENLDVMVSGPIPPNPSELIESKKNVELLSLLKEKYDYVVLDTPPVSLISDAITLTRNSDINILVTRIAQTNRSILRSTINEIESKGNIKYSFVLNGISTSGHRYGGGYGSGYGNGYGYYDDETDYKEKNKKHRRVR